MTLSTHVYALDEVDHREVFRFCQALVAKYDDRSRPPHQQRWSAKARETYRDGTWAIRPDSPWCVSNEPLQDLPAWLLLHYRPDAPLRTLEQGAACDEDCGTDCDRSYHPRACWLDVDFDTSYGYSNNGMGCGDLHAMIVVELGQWLDSLGIRWERRNEFTGDVHGGEDRYRRLIDLTSGGFEASAWFQSTVLPAISASIEDAP